MARNIWISAEHIAGKCNVAADRQSREINTNTEWMLNPTLLNKALDKLQACPDVDMFASRLNKQFSRYISFRPDPGAYLVDAFSAQWNKLNGYYFPPFSLIPRVLQKLEQDKATGIVVIPRWPTQVWYSMAMRMLISCPVLLQHNARLLVTQPPTESTSIAQETGPSHLPLIPEQLHPKWPFTSSFRYHPVCLEGWDKKAVLNISVQGGKLLQLQRDQSSFSYCSSSDKLSCRTS